MDFAGALPVFVITLREGVEAALVVGIVLAALTKSRKDDLIPWVYWGILAGIGGSLLIGQLLSWGLRKVGEVNPQLQPVLEPFLKSGLCVVAIAMLSWMLIWMTQQSQSLKGEIENSLTSSLQSSAAGWGVFTLVGIAVLREGFETVLFIFANAQQNSAALGAVLGLSGAVGIGFALFKWGIRINLRRFFQVMGIFLLLIVAGLVISALKNIDAAIYALSLLKPANTLCFSTDSCVLGALAWDVSAVLPDSQFPGVIFKALLGYRDHLYWLQVISYSLFLTIVGTSYLRSLGQPPAKLSNHSSAS
ncbi:Ferrous iron permease EfeU [Acaryochloris thomasi RCC1774]|uniref:Ferrous iron permease EfeU n=1 Tax=Acaryochloris thomasi RCC1774 TaxID=1764569 RepID=A0A2W1JMX5_9CYAN|nr:FTR1 family protein [Acaryochloris thomasi]PZD70257.1 Ferrous iron permease EfeU [Acaryochloris thomasi RCC1774]